MVCTIEEYLFFQLHQMSLQVQPCQASENVIMFPTFPFLPPEFSIWKNDCVVKHIRGGSANQFLLFPLASDLLGWEDGQIGGVGEVLHSISDIGNGSLADHKNRAIRVA